MEKIIARVGTLTVTEAEVDEFLAGLGQRGAAYNNPEGRKIILEQLIGNKLLLLVACVANKQIVLELCKLGSELSLALVKISSCIKE